MEPPYCSTPYKFQPLCLYPFVLLCSHTKQQILFGQSLPILQSSNDTLFSSISCSSSSRKSSGCLGLCAAAIVPATAQSEPSIQLSGLVLTIIKGVFLISLTWPWALALLISA